MKAHELQQEVVDRLVATGSVGGYVLGTQRNAGFVPRYVGRSDWSLRTRLLDHVREARHTHFLFEVKRTIWEAFAWECREWHRLRNLVNQIHPDAPRSLPYSCPYCLASSNFGSRFSSEAF